jgi:hypothetical protein
VSFASSVSTTAGANLSNQLSIHKNIINNGAAYNVTNVGDVTNATATVESASITTGNASTNHNHTFTPAGTISYAGAASGDNNVPPYITAYFFRRTA